MKRPPWTITVCLSIVVAIAGCQGLGGKDDTSGDPVPRQDLTFEQVERLDAAQSARAAGRDDDALRLFQEILAENPTVAPAYLGIGDIYIERRDYEKAEPAFRRAARLEPRNFDAQYGHGLALQMLQRFVDAIEAYLRALLVQPENHKVNLALATTYLQVDDPSRALRYAEKAVETDPQSGAAHANLGAIYENLGRFADAIAQYEAALEIMGNDPRLMMNLVNVLQKERRYREAANTAETLIRIQPTAAAYERLGWCHFKLREFDRSIDAYRSAVSIDATHWPALNGVGVNALNAWLLSKKRDEAAMHEARDAFRRSLRANSDQQKVIQLLLRYNL